MKNDEKQIKENLSNWNFLVWLCFCLFVFLLVFFFFVVTILDSLIMQKHLCVTWKSFAFFYLQKTPANYLLQHIQKEMDTKTTDSKNTHMTTIRQTNSFSNDKSKLNSTSRPFPRQFSLAVNVLISSSKQK